MKTYRISGSYIKHLIVVFGQPVASLLVRIRPLKKLRVLRKLAAMSRGDIYQFAFGDGLRVVARKK